MIELVPIEKVKPSTYNPRKADPRRLDILELSLKKLGFVLPLYADANGELLSGHQRHHVAERSGFTHVPVAYVGEMDLAQRKAINVLFNRSTNDMSAGSTPETLTQALARANLATVAAGCPDATDPFPCLAATPQPVKELADINCERFDDYARSAARALKGKKIDMPIVATRDGRVVNGLGRLQNAAEKGEETIRVVWISDEQAHLADVMLNLLSMDFDIHTRYRDLLRYNSFRRARRVREELGQGFVFSILKGKSTKLIDLSKPTDVVRWTKAHGRSVVDFGAGHLQETHLLESVGVRVTPFEPYRLGADGEINKAESLAIARRFLADVAANVEWTSVFIASVLNSVPFEEDRRQIVTICHALCGPSTRLYAAASSTTQVGARANKGAVFKNKTQSKSIGFSLQYEDNIRLGDFQAKPKVQKYHTVEEFYRLFKPFFQTVQCANLCHNATAICAGPLPVDRDRLAAALEFEFDLPYPDGSKMGLVAEAKEAFGKRLGITL